MCTFLQRKIHKEKYEDNACLKLKYCICFHCLGQIILPPYGNRLVFFIGSAAKTEWSLGPSTGSIRYRAWSFTSSGDYKSELLAQIVGENGDVVINTKLYEVDVIKINFTLFQSNHQTY